MKLWDLVTGGSVFVAALILAADGALKQAPNVSAHMPSFIGGELWSYAPLLLVSLAGAISIWRNAWPSLKADTNKYKAPIRMYSRSFTSQTILLDGHDYQDCDFTNVTFEFNGTTPISFSNNRIKGRVRIQTKSATVSDTVALLSGLGITVPSLSADFGPGALVKPPDRKQ